jgi:two-component system chemotaxis sensor kinase CheA
MVPEEPATSPECFSTDTSKAGVEAGQPAVAATGALPEPSPPLPDDAAPSAKSISRTVRVDIGKLDELMNIVGELVLANSAIAGVATRMRNEGFSRMAIELGKAAKGLERKLSDLQKGVMEIRMIPIGQLYEKMSRIVRKISRVQGKRVELKFFGADTELDKLIVEDISDPMMHIIRNAIDHGIESRDVRTALGKDEKGTIRISSHQKGNHVVIEIEDDGSGIDIEKVKSTAVQKGLVNDVSTVSDRDALDFIFLPGFSTNETVSEVSGRGVGMDVVRNNISAISGMVDIETHKGEGSRFIITLPITLAIIKALIISCSGKTYALPITSVLESLLMTGKDIMTVERKEVIQLRESTVPLLRLESFFDIRRSDEPPREFYVVVVGVAERRLGIAVDDLISQQDIVIKPLGDSFKRLRGVSGAADLGDQRTILVLDVGGIINETMRSGS